MLSFNQMYTECQNQTNDPDATSLTVIKQGINQGMRKFGAIMSRDWRLHEVTFDIVAGQQWYQMPEDCIRVQNIAITIGGVTYTLEEIPDDAYWGALNVTAQRGSVPRFFKVKGSDQFGIFPIPATSVSGAGDLLYERAMRDMSQADYSTGTVLVTNNSQQIVGTNTTWTAAMVGRKFTADPAGGTGDGKFYTVSAFTSATQLTLENVYSGVTGAGKSYLIGEVPDIPEEFHESLIDYGLYRYYRRRRDLGTAKDLKAMFDEQLVLAEANYSSATSSQYFRARHSGGMGKPNYTNDPSFNQTRSVT